MKTLQELIKLVDVYIKPFFSEKELTEFICCAQIYLYHVVNSIKKINKEYVISGYEACLIQNVDSGTPFYKYLYNIINDKDYVPKCKNHFNKFFINNNSNSSNIPVCISCQNKVCFGAGCKVKAFEPAKPSYEENHTKPFYNHTYIPSEKKSTKPKSKKECQPKSSEYNKLKNKYDHIKVYLNKINEVIDKPCGELPSNKDSHARLFLIVVSTSVVTFFIINMCSFNSNNQKKRHEKYEPVTLMEKVVSIFVRPLGFFLD